MRIAYFSTQFDTVKSGPGRFTQYLYGLEMNRVSLDFFSDDVHATDDPRVHKVSRIPVLSKIPLYWLIKNFLFYRAFRRESKKCNYDAILCSSTLEALYFSIFREPTPFLTMINDMDYSENSTMIKWDNLWHTLKPLYRRTVLRRVEAFIAKRSTRVVVNSKYNEKVVKEVYSLDDDKVVLLYKAVDLKKFKYVPRDIEFPKHVLFVKNEWRRGGLDIVLDVFGRLENCDEITLHVVGRHAQAEKEIRQLVASKGYRGKILFHGLLARDELIQQYQQADLYINMARSEALGVSLMEAMSCGTPVIASDVGGIPEVLEQGKAGFLVKDADELEQKMREFFAQPGKVAEKIEVGLASCQRFSVENVEQNFVRLFEGIPKQI